ncbi:MAG: hypothetical protein FJ290_08530 [Planctomycetes bacterium]|nr:hypothetical protein [Planctomycetota bacterium]
MPPRHLVGALVAALVVGCGAPGEVRQAAPPLRVVVMDPLALELACDCVAGYAQRRYDRLAGFLARRLGRPVELAFAEALSSPRVGAREGIDVVIGKCSVVRFDAARLGLKLRTVAMLSGKDGEATQRGLFIVRSADLARAVRDLAGRRILFGPEEADEKRSATLATLEAFDLPRPATPVLRPSCNAAALAVLDGEADAAVVSGYALPLLEGCGTIDKGALRIVGTTDPVPFIGVFAADRMTPEGEDALRNALLDVRRDRRLLAALESRDGFLALPAIPPDAPAWPDWRGLRRDATSPDVPARLPARRRLLWSRTLTGPGMSGLAVARGRLLVADKDAKDARDIFRCLDADTGRELWRLAYPAAGEMDFTNSPRANPVIHDGLAYLLGAFGDLHCVRPDSGEIVWTRHLLRDFGAERPAWGTCGTPLVVGHKLIVAPGAKDAALVALDRLTGKVVWATPGIQPGYGSFILATLGGVRQIVGHDATSLGGWDPETGRRLWTLVPDEEGDYNVPTPIAVEGRLLVATENNGTRLYGFDGQGRILPTPLAASEALAPDTATPVALDGLVVGASGRLVCLDLHDGLKTLWQDESEEFAHHCSFIAGPRRVLAMAQAGRLHLLAASRRGLRRLGSLDLFGDVAATERDVWSHPALVGNRLYVRNLLGVYCFLLD